MGGRRKTKLERELLGNPGHRTQAELNRPELPLVDDIGSLPAHIQGVAAEEWERVTPELVKNRMLTITDRALLEAYCTSYQRWREAEKLLKQKGFMIGKRINPAFTLVHRCVDQMHNLAVKLGRSRPALPAGGEKTDKDDEFFGDGEKVNEKKDDKPRD